MALILRSSQVNSRPNAHAFENDAPPSTVAAQLINDISTTNQPARPVQQDDLGALMQEVGSVENNAEELHHDAANLEHKHKLIYVFSRALLEQLAADDPFLPIEQTVSQASEALDVFIATIKEMPEVLDYTLKPGTQLHLRASEPFWLWLFPRILVLLGRENCEKLTEKVNTFFHVAFQAVTRSPKLWNLSSLFFLYLKQCITTSLCHLQTHHTAIRGAFSELVLPCTNRNLANFFIHESSNFTDPLLHCTYSILDADRAILHVKAILSILLDISLEAASSYDATAAFQDYVTWMLDSFIATHGIIKQWRGTPGLSANCQEKCQDWTMWAFDAVQTLLTSLRDLLTPPVLRKGYASLTVLCAQLLENPAHLSEPSVHLALCGSMFKLAFICRQYDSMRSIVTMRLLPVFGIVHADDGIRTLLGNNFQKAASALRRACGTTPFAFDDDNQADSFDSQDLFAEFQQMGLDESRQLVANSKDNEDAPPSKRRKIRDAVHPLAEITSELCHALGIEDVSGLEGLGQVAKARFTSLSDVDRCRVIECLSCIPCGASGYLTLSRGGSESKREECPVCDAKRAPDTREYDEQRSSDATKEAMCTLNEIIQCPEFVGYRRPQVLAMFALRKFALHSDEPEILSYEKSMAAQWCLQSLRSPIRELRIAAGRALAAFLRTSPVSTSNRFYIIGILRDMSEKATTLLQETYILAWAQIGRVVKDEQLNLVCRKLVEYLDNSNSIVAGTACNELLRLADASGLTVEQMLKPFWGNVAVLAVRNLLVRPQSTQMLADLLGVAVSDFLLLTQSYTVPYLVLEGNVAVIRRISDARKEKEDFLVLMDNANLVPTLALLLTQDASDREHFIMSALDRVALGFGRKFVNFQEMITQAEPASQARFLLRAAAEADDTQKPKIRLGLHFLAQTVPPPDAIYQKGHKMTGVFLEHHILGIVSRLTDEVNDPLNEYVTFERRRSVKTLEELVKVARKHARAARPQICACLQLALAQKELQGSAFSAWDTMLRTLEDEDVEPMLESTFSAIIQHWDSFDESLHDQAKSTLQYLLKARSRLVRNAIVNLPSLSSFSTLADIEAQLLNLRIPTDAEKAFQIYTRRLGHENSAVVTQALVELKAFLRKNQSFLQASAVSEQPEIVVGQLVRAILDTCVKFNESNYATAQLSAECLGLVGCLDPNRVESVREYREMVVVSNFNDVNETTDFVLYILEKVIVPEFLSATDTSLQGFLSYVMQELLHKFEFRHAHACLNESGPKTNYERLYEKWKELPDSVKDTLTPFLESKFRLQDRVIPESQYPLFRPEETGSRALYKPWVAKFVIDLLRKHSNFTTSLMFPILCRAIRMKCISIANFLLPYVVLYVIVEGTDRDRDEIGSELLHILQYEAPADSHVRREDLKLCVEAIFHILEYLARWIQEKHSRASRSRHETPETEDIGRVNLVLRMIPPEIISQRAVECQSYSRALFYWEQHIRNVRETDQAEAMKTQLLQRLQDIYTQIDEPDGIEGLSAHLHVLDIDQQILAHRKAGRWTAAQSWYEIQLAEKPDDVDVQLNLLSCLKESGQHDILLNYVEGMHTAPQTSTKILPFAAEASWATGRWSTLEKYTSMAPEGIASDFNVGVGQSLLALQKRDREEFSASIRSLREQIARSFSSATTSSLNTCHESMLRLHVLTELEMIAGTDEGPSIERAHIIESLNRRLEVIGSYLNDKQYLLGIRRAAMQLSNLDFTEGDVASAWLTSARLARKGNAMHQSFNAVLHASQLGDASATIEHARLLWKEGHHRKAIQSLNGAIETKAFISHNKSLPLESFHTGAEQTDHQNLLTARAHLLLAKWLDNAGQTYSSALLKQYSEASRKHVTWEKGHYYLGRYYSKLLESEKALAPEKQNETYLMGDTSRLVIENYLRALSYGTKYIYQTLPRILTLWLNLGTQVNQNLDPKYGTLREFIARIIDNRKSNLDSIHRRLQKYIIKIPAYMFYTALPQIVSRITHPNNEVFKLLQNIVVKVVNAHTQQALWSLLAVCTSTQSDRRTRGSIILQAVKNGRKSGSGPHDIKAMIRNGEKLAEQLLLACNAGDFQGNRTIFASLTKDLSFNQKTCLPSAMAMPVQSVLTATLPTLTDNVRDHKAFSRDIVTIDSFLDEVMVLSSLQKPRKLTARGSDGKTYGLMCKPKDDLRKDQRLMEFNSMINRSLKRDAESSRRQLYIRTYAVTPLNEECGIIEWVDGLKTLRDILFAIYKPMGVAINYKEIEAYCEEAIKSKEKLPFFTENVLGKIPPVFHKWFVQQFPEPSTWFAARLRYTRSCAVMSMVGTILGLGDRHGENILFEEGNGGTFHVDFNCLFDKGLTFAKAERVPFRLTHNMVDAMGIYGYEGPFRKSSELTLKLLRQHEETLMTILEAFIYDPTLDLLSKKPEKKRKEGAVVVPQTAQGVLDSIQRKIKGLAPGESVPLGVEGQVDQLIEQATNLSFLAGMYIGWCSFF